LQDELSPYLGSAASDRTLYVFDHGCLTLKLLSQNEKPAISAVTAVRWDTGRLPVHRGFPPKL
jgi:hypothetical protein